MRYKQILNIALVLMLLLITTVNTTLAAGDDDLMDKIYSDDKVFGYDKNKEYDITDEISLQEGFDSASALPGWQLLILGILLLFVLVVIVVPSVFGWNIIKGGKAATQENPVEAARGIKDTKMVNRAYFEEVAEGALFIGIILFAAFMFM